MAKLAILGHATRGKEVIEILEMLGGRTAYLYNGDDGNAVYFIDGLYIMAYKCEDINRKNIQYSHLKSSLKSSHIRLGIKLAVSILKTTK